MRHIDGYGYMTLSSAVASSRGALLRRMREVLAMVRAMARTACARQAPDDHDRTMRSAFSDNQAAVTRRCPS